MKIYASVHIGSYGISLKVFEIIKGRHLKKIDEQRRKMDIVRDILRLHRLSRESLLLMTDILCDMKETIDAYKADDYDVYAGSIFFAADNIMTLIDQVRAACGITIKVLDNSRHRFLMFEALCSISDLSEVFNKRTVLADVGGSGIQLTLFSEGRLFTSQHVFLGASNVWEDLRKIRKNADYRQQLQAMIDTELDSFTTTFLEKRPPQNLVIINNPFMPVNRASSKKDKYAISTSDYIKQLKKAMKENTYSVSNRSGGGDISDLFTSFLLLYRSLIDHMPVEELYIPPVSLHEGMAYNYAYTNRLLPPPRDFDGDTLAGAWAIAERYNCDSNRSQIMLSLSGMLFSAIKKRHGMDRRCELILSAAAIMLDCGKFISLANEGLCTYTIITSSEIIGFSDRERLMIAWVCYFYKDGVKGYDSLSDNFTRAEYFTIQKLTAILAIAGALDRSHARKMDEVKFRFNGRDELDITIDTQDSMALEKGLFDDRAQFFENIFAIRPVLKTVRIRRNPV